MKNKILLATNAVLLSVFLCSCEGVVGETKYETITVDSCEYLHKYNGYQSGESFTHKGNCKYCAERSKKNCQNKDLIK